MDSQSPMPVARPRASQGFSFDVAAIWILTIASGLAAIALIPSSTIPFLYTKICLLAIGGLIALIFYILARLTRGNVIVPPMQLVGALWLIPLAYALSTLFSGAGISASFFGTELESDTFGFVLLLALLATLTALVFRRIPHYKIFFSISAIVLAVVLISEVVFLFLGQIIPNTFSASSNLVGSFVDLGMFVGLGLILTLLAIRFMSFKGWKNSVLWVVGIIALLVLIVVNSTLVWVLVGLAALALFIEAILRRRVVIDESDLDGVATIVALENDHEPEVHELHSLLAPLITLVFALIFIIGGTSLGNLVTTAAHTNVLDVRPSWQSTFAIGSHTYASSPIFGSGPNTFGQQWLKFRDRSLNSTVFWNVDFTSGIGIIPTSFVTEGLLGVLAWIVFLGLFIFIGLRALLFRTPTDPYIRYISIASFSGALYVLALMVFAVPGPVVLIAGFVFAGLFISTLRYAGVRQEWGIIFARNPRVGFLIVFALTLLLLGSVVAGYVVVERYLADYEYAVASNDLSSSNLSAADTAVSNSLTFAPVDRTYQLQALIGIAHMNAIAANTTLAPAQAQQQFQAALSQSIQAALQATKLGPNNYQNWVVLGSVYQTVVPLNIDGAYENAKDAYTHAIALNPTDPTLEYTLAQLEIAQKNPTGAIADLNQAISLKQDYTQAIFTLAQLEAQQGNASEALQAAESAAYFSPNDPTILYEVGLLESANGNNTAAIQALTQAISLNPSYANAHFFLGVIYALQSQYPQAIAQLQTVAAFSSANAQAVAGDITALQAGKNPFPASSLGALGIPQPGTQTSSVTSVSTTTQSTGH
jgi:tetratricopeptide (TPR) repeat protein